MKFKQSSLAFEILYIPYIYIYAHIHSIHTYTTFRCNLMYSMNSKIPCREIIEATDFPEISKPISINQMIEHHHYECAGPGSVSDSPL